MDVPGGVKFNDTDITALDSADWQTGRHVYKFGFIFQRYHQPPHLSADENVQIPTVYAGVKTHDRRARTRVAHAFRTSGADQLSVVETIGWPATAALPRQATKRRFSYSQLIKTG